MSQNVSILEPRPFWKTNPEWYESDFFNGVPLHLTEAAPPEAHESFAAWKKARAEQGPPPEIEFA